MLRSDTLDVQSQLGQYCRDGELVELPGSRADRLPQYRRLVFNVVKGILDQAYPISRKVLGSDTWLELVTRFFKEHKCQEPEVWRMPQELVEYVEKSGYATNLEKPWLTELLYFEWLEIEVHGMEDESLPNTESLAGHNWQQNPLAVNPYHRLIHLTYPVHKEAAQDYDARKGNYYVLIYRDLDEMAVHFMELSPFAAIFLEFLKKESISFQDALANALHTFNRELSPELEEQASTFVQQWHEKQVILGSLPN